MIIGIDLGTTNSLVAYFEDGKAHIIPNRLGKNLTPSIVCLDTNNTILVGETAKEYGYMHPESMAKVFKRAMGTEKKIPLNDQMFTPEELSSFVLRSLKEDAEVYLNETIEEAVISVPAYFNDNQRKATKRAGELAGLKVSRIISEPTAAAIAYGVGDYNKMERCMVLDLGGGTFDVSILEYYKSIMEVHAIAGDNFLGGEDFTLALMELHLKDIGCSKEEVDLNSLYKQCEKAKCDFSTDEEVVISSFVDDIQYSSVFTEEDYEKACFPLLERLQKPIEKSLKDAKLTLDDIDRIILVGGATRLNIVRNYLEKLTGIIPNFYVDPDTCVALGAAYQAAMKERNKQIKEIIFTDVCPFTLGTEVTVNNGVFEESGHYLPIIERNTVIPVSKTQQVYTAHDDQEKVTVRILQGESRMTKNNFELGEITIDVPKAPRGKESIDITYTYDVNSLLEVVVKVNSTGLVKKVVIQNDSNKLTDKQVEERLEELSYLKQNPRESEENMLIILRGNRLYEESFGKDKELIEEALNRFDAVLATKTRLEIEKERKRITELFDSLEHKTTNSFMA